MFYTSQYRAVVWNINHLHMKFDKHIIKCWYDFHNCEFKYTFNWIICQYINKRYRNVTRCNKCLHQFFSDKAWASIYVRRWCYSWFETPQFQLDLLTNQRVSSSVFFLTILEKVLFTWLGSLPHLCEKIYLISADICCVYYNTLELVNQASL